MSRYSSDSKYRSGHSKALVQYGFRAPTNPRDLVKYKDSDRTLSRGGSHVSYDSDTIVFGGRTRSDRASSPMRSHGRPSSVAPSDSISNVGSRHAARSQTRSSYEFSDDESVTLSQFRHHQDYEPSFKSQSRHRNTREPSTSRAPRQHQSEHRPSPRGKSTRAGSDGGYLKAVVEEDRDSEIEHGLGSRFSNLTPSDRNPSYQSHSRNRSIHEPPARDTSRCGSDLRGSVSSTEGDDGSDDGTESDFYNTFSHLRAVDELDELERKKYDRVRSSRKRRPRRKEYLECSDSCDEPRTRTEDITVIHKNRSGGLQFERIKHKTITFDPPKSQSRHRKSRAARVGGQFLM